MRIVQILLNKTVRFVQPISRDLAGLLQTTGLQNSGNNRLLGVAVAINSISSCGLNIVLYRIGVGPAGRCQTMGAARGVRGYYPRKYFGILHCWTLQ